MLTITLKISRNNWISLPYITRSSSQKEPPSNDIVSVDDSLTNAEPLPTDDAMFCHALVEGYETEDDTDDVSKKPICPQSSDVRQALDELPEYMLFSDSREYSQMFKRNSVLVYW